MPPDAEYLDELLKLIQNRADWGNECPNLNHDLFVNALRMVPGDDGFDDLEVELSLHPGAEVRRCMQTLFDRQWRRDSGYLQPRDAVVHVVREIDSRSYGLWGRRSADPTPPREISTGRRDASWREVLSTLGGFGPVSTDAEQVRVLTEDGPVTVHLTPDTWADLTRAALIEEVDEGEGWYGMLDALMLTRRPGETHIVVFRGDLMPSVRAKLPPVRSWADLPGPWAFIPS